MISKEFTNRRTLFCAHKGPEKLLQEIRDWDYKKGPRFRFDHRDIRIKVRSLYS